MSHKLGLLCILIFFLVPAHAEVYLLSTHGQVSFSIYHFATNQEVKGEFHQFAGTIDFNPEIRRINKMKIEIAVESIDTGDEKRDQVLKNDSLFFEAPKHPKMLFVLDFPVKLVLNRGVETTGQLTIKGITKPVMIALTYKGKRKEGPFFKATGRLSRHDFGMTWNELLPSGIKALSDEVQLYIEAIIEPLH